MKLPAFLRTPLGIAALAALLVFGLTVALSTCHTRQASELSGRARRAAEATTASARQQARRDSALAAAHADSATSYHRQQHEMAPTSATDTTALRRFFSNYFHW